MVQAQSIFGLGPELLDHKGRQCPWSCWDEAGLGRQSSEHHGSILTPAVDGDLALFYFFLLLLEACKNLAPQAEIESTPPVEARSPNHWTTRQVLSWCCLDALPKKIVS